MDQRSKDLAERAWKSLVTDKRKEAECDPRLPQELLAIALVLKCKAEYIAAVADRDFEKAVSALYSARRTWQFACVDIAGWLVDIWPPIGGAQERLQVRDDWAGDEQRALSMSIQHQIGRDMAGILDGEYDTLIDPVPIVIPRWLIESLMDALQALPYGEVRQIVKPSSSGRHGEAWTLNKMRLRALEHVAFMCARGGSNKIDAQRRVAKVMNISVRTLQDWDNELSSEIMNQQRVQSARMAGELQQQIDDDPSLSEEDLSSYHEYRVLLSFRHEPLKAFGEKYRLNPYSKRHYQAPTTGE